MSDKSQTTIAVVPDDVIDLTFKLSTIQKLRDHEQRIFFELIEERDRLRDALQGVVDIYNECCASRIPEYEKAKAALAGKDYTNA